MPVTGFDPELLSEFLKPTPTLLSLSYGVGTLLERHEIFRTRGEWKSGDVKDGVSFSDDAEWIASTTNIEAHEAAIRLLSL